MSILHKGPVLGVSDTMMKYTMVYCETGGVGRGRARLNSNWQFISVLYHFKQCFELEYWYFAKVILRLFTTSKPKYTLY